MPLGFEDEKKNVLSRIGRTMTGLIHRADTDNVAKGQDQMLDTANKEGIISGKIKPEVVASAQAADKGKLYENTGESGTFNVATGDPKLNKLGEAKANDENASAANRGKEIKNKSFEALQQERIAVQADIDGAEKKIKDERAGMKDLNKEGKAAAEARIALVEKDLAAAKAYKVQVMDRMSVLGNATPGAKPKADDKPKADNPKPEAPKPAAAGDNPKPAAGDLPAPKTKAEFDALPARARY
jgi:hypothetical protein